MAREVHEGPDDDRTDTAQRRRIDELASSWNLAVERLDARYWRVAIMSLSAVLLAIGAIGACYLLLGRIDDQASSNTAALCALRQDLERRVESSKEFLIAHPQGIPGISAATIRKSVSDQGRTITALSGLDCRA